MSQAYAGNSERLNPISSDCPCAKAEHHKCDDAGGDCACERGCHLCGRRAGARRRLITMRRGHGRLVWCRCDNGHLVWRGCYGHIGRFDAFGLHKPARCRRRSVGERIDTNTRVDSAAFVYRRSFGRCRGRRHVARRTGRCCRFRIGIFGYELQRGLRHGLLFRRGGLDAGPGHA